jgi:hypothetical protein
MNIERIKVLVRTIDDAESELLELTGLEVRQPKQKRHRRTRAEIEAEKQNGQAEMPIT